MYVAQKPCSFAGQSFRIGDTIPEGLVLPEAVTRLVKGGFIAEVGNAGPLLPASTSIEAPELLQVPIIADEGETTVEMTTTELLDAIRTIQKPTEGIAEDIQNVENGDVLIFIDVLTGGAHHEMLKEKAQGMTPTYTETELMKMRRDELAVMATDLGMEVTEDDTKKVLTEYILQNQ